jgi:hypothetical protein
VWQHRARHAEHRRERHIEHLRPLVVAHLDHGREAAEPSVVDQHVDVTELADRRGDQRVHLILARHVAYAGGCGAAVASASLAAVSDESALVLVADQHARAFLEAALARREADAGAGGRGDHDGLVLEQAVARTARSGAGAARSSAASARAACRARARR